MYYVERVINGVLCCKSTPKGKWRELSKETLTNRILKLEKKLLEIKQRVA